jgi:Tfp pilus assembly protein PilF
MDQIVIESKPDEAAVIAAQNGERSRRGRETILALLLVAGTMALYNPATHNGFINYDDNSYITLNAYVQAGLTKAGIHWAFTTFDVSNWHPITWLSHMLDCQLFGLNPVGHHFVSILLHSFNVALLFWLLLRATGTQWRSFFVAALFAVHPLNVESVSWVAERKNVLSTLFGLLTIAAYGWYVRQRSWQRYGVMLLLFALSLMTKPMLVTLPFALLLLDFWPLERIRLGQWPKLRGLILEKLPLMALSVASSMVTVRAQRSSMSAMVWKDPNLPRFFHLWNAIYSYAQYLRKMFWPSKLAIFYPLHTIELWQVALSALLLGGITVVVFRRRKDGYLLTGWLWYLGTLVPVIGVVSIGRQAMADRYTYVPLIGIFVLLVWGGADLVNKVFSRMAPAFLIVPLAGITALGTVTHNQLAYWHDSISLFTHVIAVTKHNYSAHVNLGGALDREGRADEALQQYYAALQDNPHYGTAAYYIAVQMHKRGRFTEAIHYYELAISLTQDEDPEMVSHAYSNLGQVNALLGRQAVAKTAFEKALALDALNFNSNLGLAKILIDEGKAPPAIGLLTRALSVFPSAEVYYQLGRASEQLGQLGQAKEAYRLALQIDPSLRAAQERLRALAP